MWRQYFESLCHEENSFVTLTYSDKFEPDGGNLEPRDLQLFIKRVRFAVRPHKIRYFAVGEYGEETWRPHYHLSVFGLCGHSIVGSPPKPFGQLVDECWGRGFVKVDEFSEKTAQYVAGYVVKKFTDWRDSRLGNRVPEFARMSLKPAIGAEAMKVIAKGLADYVDLNEDVPRFVMFGKKKVPLGRTLLRKLREAVGFTDDYIASLRQKGSMDKSLEVLALFKNAVSDEGVVTPRKAYLDATEQALRNVESRSKVWKKKGGL